MTDQLTIEQRFALTRARYEVSRMSRPALEKTALRLLRARMEQKNGVQNTLRNSGILFKIDERQEGLPEIISEETNRKKTLSLLAQNQDRDAHSTDKTHQTHGAGWQVVLAYGVWLALVLPVQ